MQYITFFLKQIESLSEDVLYLFWQHSNNFLLAMEFTDLRYAQEKMFNDNLLKLIFGKVDELYSLRDFYNPFMYLPKKKYYGFLKTPKIKLLKKQRDMRLFKEAFVSGDMKLIKWFVKDKNFNPFIPSGWITELLDARGGIKLVRFLCRKKILTNKFDGPILTTDVISDVYISHNNPNVTLDFGVNTVSYCLFPAESQPSGHINNSRCKEFYLNESPTTKKQKILKHFGIQITSYSSFMNNYRMFNEGMSILRFAT